MALEGTFKDFGLADIFQLIGLQKKTGVLTVRGEGGRLVTVSFEKGAVVFADEFQRTEAERLGNVLLRTRLLSNEQLDQAMAVQKSTSQRLGHVLVGQQLITQQALTQALQLQVKESVYRLFRWQEGSYHFSPEPVTFDREIYAPIPAEFVLMEGTRMIDEWPILEKKIPSFQVIFERIAAAVPPRRAASRPVKVGIEDLMDFEGGESGAPAATSFERGGEALGPRENAILGLIDGARVVQDLIDLGHLGEFETCKVLYGLLSLNLIRVRETGAPAPAVPAAAARHGARGLRGAREYAVVALAALLVLVAFLFNPWGIVAQGFRRGQGRRESAVLVDAVRLRRVRLALEVFYLEKQAYPPALEKLAESGLLQRGELRGRRGASFVYRGGEREYRLEREGQQ
jgi:hypothetical protein